MSEPAQIAWERLQDALAHNTPACLGDDRYITDRHDLDNDAREELEAVCWSCPVRGACAAYATEAKPKAGYYPGMNLRGRPNG